MGKAAADARAWRLTSWVAAGVPWVGLLAFVVMAAEVRMGLGHWPKLWVEGYDSRFFAVMDRVCGGLLFALFLAPVVWVAAMAASRSSVRENAGQVAVLIAGGVGFLLFWKYCPGDFMGWYLE